MKTRRAWERRGRRWISGALEGSVGSRARTISSHFPALRLIGSMAMRASESMAWTRTEAPAAREESVRIDPPPNSTGPAGYVPVWLPRSLAKPLHEAAGNLARDAEARLRVAPTGALDAEASMWRKVQRHALEASLWK